MTTQLSTPALDQPSKGKRRGILAGVGVGAVMLACAAACAIPLIAAAGVAAGGGAIIAGEWPIAIGLLLITGAVTAGLLWYRKNKRARALAAGTDGDGASCGCGGNCGC